MRKGKIMTLNLDKAVEKAATVAIAGHVRPDGDCVGSALAVYQYIRRFHPQVEAAVFLEPIPLIFTFLQYADEICSPLDFQKKTFDLCIVVDCGDPERLGDAAIFFEKAKHSVCIDHHVSNRAFAEENHIVPDASSTCELIYDLLPKDRITKEIAESLYTGIVTDTGVFQYSCTSEHTMDAAGDLMSRGIDFSTIVDRVFFQKTFVQQKIMGQALLNAKMYEDIRCIATVLTQEEMDMYKALPKHLEGIASQLRATKGVEVCLFLYPLGEELYKVSARSAKVVDVSAIAMKYRGGGHVRAAGFSLQGDDPWKMVQMLTEDIRLQMREKGALAGGEGKRKETGI